MRPRLAGRALAVAGLALSVAAPTAAAPVKLVTGSSYEPFTDPNLPKGGMATAIVKAVYAEMGKEVSISFRPWKRGYRKTLNGEYAATFPYVTSEKRKKDYRYSDPIFTVRNKPITSADSDFKADTVSDLAGSTYCLPRGYAPPSEIKDMTQAGELKRMKPSNLAQCMRMIRAGRADFTLANTIVGRTTAVEVFGSTDPVRFLDLVVTRSELHVIFPKTRADVDRAVKRFNKALKAIRANGTFDEIVNNFVGQS